MGAFRVSAKEDINIGSAFSALVRQMLIKAIKDEEEKAAEDTVEADQRRAMSFQLQARKTKKEKEKDGCKC